MDEPAPQKTVTATRTCLDCGAPVDGAFCASCGMRTDTRRLALSDLAAEALATVFGARSRLLRTLGALLLRPGRTAREYVEGHRRRYVGPLQLAMITSAMWFTVLSLAIDHEDPTQHQIAVFGQLLNLALLPLIAIGVQIGFVRSGTRYIEHVAVLFYLASIPFLWRAALAGYGGLATAYDLPVNAALVNQFDGLAALAFNAWGLMTFHSRLGLFRRLLGTAVSLFGMIVLSLIATIGILAASKGMSPAEVIEELERQQAAAEAGEQVEPGSEAPSEPEGD